MIDVTMLIPTYNNSDMLEKTLESLSVVDFSGHRVEVAIINNNSTDSTISVIERFSAKLPISYIFERKQGKNCALNCALDKLELGDVVFFTDDDVTFPRDLFSRLKASVRKWNEYSVFGGNVFLIWPEQEIPYWAKVLASQGLAFSKLDLGSEAKSFSVDKNPVGTNIWMRKEIFDQGMRFDETIGPRPKNRIMGSETSFLNTLRKKGYSILYDPSIKIGHRVPASLLQKSSIIKRAFTSGRGGARLRVMYEERLYDRFIIFWLVVRVLSFFKWGGYFLYTFISFPNKLRIVKRWKPAQGLGWNYELIRMMGYKARPIEARRKSER
ncbi:hypothetical protein B4O97_15910 [Marispirochaeta aestuarii]|uniref:Glycosyltransferase 2-like domain-containing protein n=1 Tax=Marispirochaeta aestuarii TaxID=1963862 RepID=A0A1Y1RUE2_9SPIO|nr:glycosyltransferase family 2 protein [Marispirochaeta aestuarii]ORC32643.1 hypothetical protein B4O97_15910 [Marispirochaeta aestuarii]